MMDHLENITGQVWNVSLPFSSQGAELRHLGMEVNFQMIHWKQY